MTDLNALANTRPAKEAPAHADPAVEGMDPGTCAPSVLKAVLAGFDGLAHGVALFDAAGRLRYANTEANTVLARWRGWAQHPSSEAHLRWREALGRVCGRQLRELFEYRDAETLRYASLAPVPLQGQCFAFVTFAREELCGPIELQMYCLRHGLSPAESQVLRQLCRGMKASEIAREHGVSGSTVMTQISAIRNKTLHGSIRELLRALSKMPPLNPVLAVCK